MIKATASRFPWCFERSSIALACSPAEARTVPAHICTVASSGSESASCVASWRPDEFPAECCARATRDCDTGSLDFERADNTCLDCPRAIWARYLSV